VTAASARSAEAASTPVAVIVPVLNDSEALGRLLDEIDEWAAKPREVVVVAGAADAELANLCKHRGHRCIEAPPNRGMQLDTGARASDAPVLWFLHADADVPRDAIVRLVAAVDAGAESGCFAFSFQGPRTPTKTLLERFVALRIRCGGIPYGDQALFATGKAYRACGGFAHQPLFEEVRLVRRLRRRGTFQRLPDRVRVSTRRWDRDGWWRRTLHNRWLAICYMLGMSAERLAGAYGQPHSTIRKKGPPRSTT
jgi:rSAM/selenodomain-associated transferase 2